MLVLLVVAFVRKEFAVILKCLIVCLNTHLDSPFYAGGHYVNKFIFMQAVLLIKYYLQFL